MSWQSRASIFLKAAELIAGHTRSKINASTMLGQSKNIFQAEIDAACEFIDFLNFNASYMEEIYKNQPESSEGMWNRLDYRPLEGFIFAISPFNFTSIAGNLCAAPALMGNTIIWKPAYPQIYSANVIMEVFREAGLPDGVINLIYVDGPVAEILFLKIKILLDYILQAVLPFLNIYGKKLVIILIVTSLTQELLVKLVGKII